MKSNTIRFCVKLVLEILLIIMICIMFSVTPTSATESNDSFSHTFIHDYDGAGDCEICHREISEGITTSVHNTWEGKNTGMNDFCGAVESNEDMCGKCHIGFGLPTYDFSTENIDCLICHAPDYKKTALGPDPSIDLDVAISGITGDPTRAMCLRCHATAGGGNNRKRGDLELAMGAEIVSPDLDVHMNKNMSCQDCHTFDDHHVAGQGMDLRVADSDKIVTCDDSDCHGTEPHTDSIYNMHTKRLACTSCHITAYGKLEFAETERNWEKAFIPGMLTKENNPAPIHVWWNRESEISNLGDTIIPTEGSILAKPMGDVNDPDSKIYAARLHKGRQPWNGDILLPFKVATVKTDGMIRAIFDTTGKMYDPVQYINTSRYMGLFHGVSPAKDALTCDDCHDNHKLDFDALGYNVEYDVDGNLISATKTGSTVNFVTMSGKDCISCHNIDSFLPTELQIDFNAMDDPESIHYNLNRDAESTLDSRNTRCWACHGDGDGSEEAQPSGHGKNFDSPKDCNNGDCHTLNQSVFMEPMISAHFMGADDLDNPGHVYPTANISTSSTCDTCHTNSIVENQGDSMVVHYGSTRDLMGYPDFVSTDCTYCHEDHYRGSPLAEIAEDWGDATDMMDDEADMIEDDIDKTMIPGDVWELRNGYMFEVRNVDLIGDNAHVYLTQNGEIVDEQIINVGTPYEYDHDITVEGHTFEQTDVYLNLTGVMRHNDGAAAVFEGRSIKRIHSETSNEACYACHMETYGKNDRYTITDRSGDKTYYTKMLIDFDYYDDNESKIMSTGDVWDLGDGFRLTVSMIDVDSDLARLELERNGVLVEDYVIHTDDTFYYEDDFSTESHIFEDLRIFTANVTGIFRSHDEELIKLEDARLISPDIDVIDVEDTDGYNGFRLDGYNISTFNVGDDFGGGKPLTLHEASLTNGWDIDFGNCINCHDKESGMDIMRVDSPDAHKNLNGASEDTNRACWACHGTGNEPGVHPDKPAKDCVDCHIDNVLFDAPDLSDETHSEVTDCTQCHAKNYPDTHLIGAFSPDTPKITSTEVDSTVPELITIKATATAGWNMKIRAFEFWLDDEDPKTIPTTGLDQTGDFEFNIDTSDLSPGDHVIHIRARERDHWGPEREVSITIHETTSVPEYSLPDEPESHTGMGISVIAILIALVHCVGLTFIILNRRRKS